METSIYQVECLGDDFAIVKNGQVVAVFDGPEEAYQFKRESEEKSQNGFFDTLPPAMRYAKQHLYGALPA
ncbi:hypothetical protein [Thiomicrorhabdus sp.]|uniref:hypothetical protein n=1 Tax=Thiomicrorhabdus sp. TaxID=2039724 RepID=UPI0029C8C64C|nr:hypothetical protein [Thiomicrorhabdus sp.]